MIRLRDSFDLACYGEYCLGNLRQEAREMKGETANEELEDGLRIC